MVSEFSSPWTGTFHTILHAGITGWKQLHIYASVSLIRPALFIRPVTLVGSHQELQRSNSLRGPFKFAIEQIKNSQDQSGTEGNSTTKNKPPETCRAVSIHGHVLPNRLFIPVSFPKAAQGRISRGHRHFGCSCNKSS